LPFADFPFLLAEGDSFLLRYHLLIFPFLAEGNFQRLLQFCCTWCCLLFSYG
jgi:hypothetical protein